MNTTFYMFGVAGAGMIGYGIWSYRKPDSNSREAIETDLLSKSPPFRLKPVEGVEGVEQTKLSNVSNLWTGSKIYLKNIAKYWREQVGEEGEEPSAQMPAFKHEEITRFYNDIIAPRKIIKGPRRTIITKLLEILDKEGTCPSVVGGCGNIKDPDSDFDESTFSQLATISLYQHSLAVARKFVSKTREEIHLPNILITALGHDLGKIPAHHNKYYSTGDHPQISLIILASIPEYVKLPNRSELDRIIRGHHQLAPNNPLAVALKQCDQEVRHDELGSFINRTNENVAAEEYESDEEMEDASDDEPGGEGVSETKDANPEIQATLETPHADSLQEQVEQHEVTDHPLGSEPKAKYKPKKVPLPSWYDADNIISVIKQQVNQVERTPSGVHWQAVSLANGIVYVKPEGLWKAIQETCAGRDATILAAAGDEAAKRDFIFTVVWELGKVKDAIAIEMMASSYFTIKTAVISDSDKITNWLLIPFRASAFGVLPSEFESTKPAILKKLVKDIRIKEAAK